MTPTNKSADPSSAETGVTREQCIEFLELVAAACPGEDRYRAAVAHLRASPSTTSTPGREDVVRAEIPDNELFALHAGISSLDGRGDMAAPQALALRKLLARLRSPGKAEDGWQPIETAPKDGKSVLLWWPRWQEHEVCHGEPVVAWWNGSWWQAGNYWCDSTWPPPTHWMPQPPPPSKAGGKAAERLQQEGEGE